MDANPTDNKPLDAKAPDAKVSDSKPAPLAPAQPTSAPTPSPATPPSPPPPSAPAGTKPPADGSFFLPDSSSSSNPGGKATTGSGSKSAGAMPAPLPLPTMPDSIGGTSGPGRNTPIAATKPPPASAAPQVIVYDEVAYVCQPGDTFETISKRFYQADTFAVALQRHNRHHFQASDQMARDGTIRPGEKIFIPPADILEQRYGDAIGKSTTPTSATIPASHTVPGGSPPPAPLPPSGASPLSPRQ